MPETTIASSLGSSLSRVSSSSPSSTPTDSESHLGSGGSSAGPQVISASHSHAHSLAPSAHNSSANEDDTVPPPIASRPERTKSIVSFLVFANITARNVKIICLNHFTVYSSDRRYAATSTPSTSN